MAYLHPSLLVCGRPVLRALGSQVTLDSDRFLRRDPSAPPLPHFTGGTSEHEKLCRARDQCREILKYVNEAVKQTENRHRLEGYQKRLDTTSLERASNPLAAEFKVAGRGCGVVSPPHTYFLATPRSRTLVRAWRILLGDGRICGRRAWQDMEHTHPVSIVTPSLDRQPHQQRPDVRTQPGRAGDGSQSLRER